MLDPIRSKAKRRPQPLIDVKGETLPASFIYRTAVRLSTTGTAVTAEVQTKTEKVSSLCTLQVLRESNSIVLWCATTATVDTRVDTTEKTDHIHTQYSTVVSTTRLTGRVTPPGQHPRYAAL